MEKMEKTDQDVKDVKDVKTEKEMIEEFTKVIFLFYLLFNETNEDMEHLFDALYNEEKLKPINIKNRNSCYVLCYVLIKSENIKNLDSNLVKAINRYSGEPSTLPIISECIKFLELFEIN